MWVWRRFSPPTVSGSSVATGWSPSWSRMRQRRFVGVFGPSGCGKSSLLRAGLVPALAAAAEAETTQPVVAFTPGAKPLDECAVQLARLNGASAVSMRADLGGDPANLHLRIRQMMVDRPGEQDLVLVVDQFEEVFTLCSDRDERSRFIDALITATAAAASRTRLVLGVRADFYGHCAHHPRLVDALRDGQVMVEPMTADELRQAITPSSATGLACETGWPKTVTGCVSTANSPMPPTPGIRSTATPVPSTAASAWRAPTNGPIPARPRT
jgi:energy-coupling factor transporter ATP-binding protein EcfA2